MDSALLANEALKLPAWERAQLVDTLWRSLESGSSSSLERAWAAESRARWEAYQRGELEALEGESTLQEIEASLGR